MPVTISAALHAHNHAGLHSEADPDRPAGSRGTRTSSSSKVVLLPTRRADIPLPSLCWRSVLALMEQLDCIRSLYSGRSKGDPIRMER